MSNQPTFLPLGANLHTWPLASSSGSPLPLVLSFPREEAYTATGNKAYFGETIGRVANRIKNASLSLNGTKYPLAANNGPNTLHGGVEGWGKQRWSGPFDEPSSQAGVKRTRFELTSADGDQGFPGTVHAKAWYTTYLTPASNTSSAPSPTSASSTGEVSNVEVEYEVVFPSGSETGKHGEQIKETAVSVTNHTAFSIGPLLDGGKRSLAGTKVTLETDQYQVVDDTIIPTGKIEKHPHVPSAGAEITLGEDEPKFDECFVLSPAEPESVPLDTRKSGLRKLMSARNEESGVKWEAWSTEPAFQFYSGEYIDVDYTDPKTGEKTVQGRRSGFCCEASRYVDCAGRKEWEGMVRMERGNVWGSRTVYRAWRV